jgi:hypothetical protein
MIAEKKTNNAKKEIIDFKLLCAFRKIKYQFLID